jgi:hypothetical protein
MGTHRHRRRRIHRQLGSRSVTSLLIFTRFWHVTIRRHHPTDMKDLGQVALVGCSCGDEWTESWAL